jgi:hypothetical protein
MPSISLWAFTLFEYSAFVITLKKPNNVPTVGLDSIRSKSICSTEQHIYAS